MQAIKFSLILYFLLPPPTESTKIQSFFVSFDTFKYSTYDVFQPSSFILAVNSEVLSDGA